MTGTASSSDISATESVQTEIRTFLIADVRGYTRFTLEMGDEAAARLAGSFADTADSVVSARGGKVIELRGDEALAVFASARQALRAALDLQSRIGDDPSIPVQVGIGLDAGEAIPVKGGYRGAALNLAARLCNLAGPGEVLASDTVANLARKIEGLEYADRGTVQLKGFADPVKVIEVHQSAPASHPAAGEDVPASSHSSTAGDERRTGQLPIGGFLGALPEGTLVSRDEELARLRSVIEAVAAGAGRLVLLAGEPGVGKTRLAQEVTLLARNRGFLVATGRCYEPSAGVPFYPFLEALSNAYVVAPGSVRAMTAQRWPHLGRLFPDHLIPPPTPPSESQEEQERLFRAVAGFVITLAETAPVTLLLDDLHWADGSSLGLLQHLARHTRGHRVLLFGTYRDVEVDPDHPLEAALLDLGRERLVERIAVRRLAGDGTAAMMVSTLGADEMAPELTRLVYSRTEGNPFFVEEVVRSLVERGDVYRQDGRWTLREIDDIEVPESIRSVIGRRVARLSEATQDLLLAASVLGQTFTFDEIQTLEGRAEDEVETALEEAVTSALVRETGRDTYAFNHALTQQSLYGRLSSRRKRRLHLATGEALEDLPQRTRDRRAAELAWHFLEGDDPERALRYSMLAGDRAEDVFAHAEAERHYRTAVELARETENRASEVEALARLGTTLNVQSRYTEALRVLDEAADICRRGGNLGGEVRVTIAIGNVHRSAGSTTQGIEVVRAMLERLEGSGRTSDIANLCTVLEPLCFARGLYAEGLSAAERAADLARQLGDNTILARAEVGRATELGALGRRVEYLRVLEDAIPLCEKSGDLNNLTRALVNAANIYYGRGEFEKARVVLERALQTQEPTHNLHGLAFSLSNLGDIHTFLGEWKQAEAYLQRALDMADTSPTAWWAAYPPLQAGILYFRAGRWDDAEHVLQQALGVGEHNEDLQARRLANLWLAELEIVRGQPESALRRLEPFLDRPGLQESEVTDMLPTLARAALASGNVSRAAEIVDEAIARATAEGKRLFVAEALLAQGQVLAAQDRRQEAQSALNDSLQHARDMRYPHLEARVLHKLGLQTARGGDLETAAKHLRQASEIFRRLGAEPYAQDVETDLGPITTSSSSPSPMLGDGAGG